jgi:cysteine desulfurase family protein
VNQLRIHLDNASTSWPKPESVYAAVEGYLRDNGAPAGRGTYPQAIEVERKIAKLRTDLARVLGLSNPAHVVFTFSGTDSLHLAFGGLLHAGDHVVTTVAEHNSVLRPLHEMQQRIGISVDYAQCDAAGIIQVEHLASLLRSNTRLVVASHVSNVSGAIQPIAEIGAVAKNHGAVFLVDGAQAAGHLEVSLPKLGCDVYAASGHKGLWGPLGTGVLCLSDRAADIIRPIRCGGTGSQSQDESQPWELPDRLESGNLNVPGLFGLAAGVDYLLERGIDSIREHHLALTGQLLRGLAEIPGVRVLGPSSAENRVGLVSLTLEAYDPMDAAGVLSGSFGICTRAGLHCAPRMHEHFGTLEQGGALRVSFGFANTAQDVDAFLEGLRALTSQ